MLKAHKTDLFILGAGLPHKGDQPSALMDAGPSSALSWILGAVDGRVDCAHFVGGYHLEEVRAKYPELNFTRNPEWQTTGSAGSLLHAPLSPTAACIVCYADIVFRRGAVDSLLASEASVCVAVDSLWRQRYSGRTASDIERCEKVIFDKLHILSLGTAINADLANGEFVGLVHLKPAAIRRILDLAQRFPEMIRKSNLSSLIEFLRLSGLDVHCVDVAGDWAELNEPQDLAKFVMGTKAETLARLRERVTSAIILDQVSFTSAEWSNGPDSCVARVLAALGTDPVVVRSSTSKEDSFSAASAGVYKSILNVDPTAGLVAAVNEVFASYGQMRCDEHVLVQPFVSSVAMHGVIFTRTLDRGAPYYVINYDESGETDAITSGTARESRTLFVYRDAGVEMPQPFAAVLDAVKELEALTSYDALDIEFAVDKANKVYIFQVRPIAVQWGENHVSDELCQQALQSAISRWKFVATPSPFIPGGSPVFGVMPDWNPAEIIGTAPRMLAESLYRTLITDDVWAAQRAGYGYRDVRPQPLMTSFAGRPYIDVRASFTSFVPRDLNDELAGRLVSFYLTWLKNNPHLHDKVEFDVVPTCMSLDFRRWEERLIEMGGFSIDEVDALARGLLSITVSAFGRIDEDFRSIERLEKRFEVIREASGLSHGEKARLYLGDCRRFGTLAFANLARAGFIAVILLRSAESEGILSAAAIEAFMSSLNTVTREFSDDVAKTASGAVDLATLVERYGHLRPGTYDITSPCYSSSVDTYIRPLVEAARGSTHAPLADETAWKRERDKFFDRLKAVGLPSDPALVESFLRAAISGRELAKFHFTRNLSAAMEEIALLGEEWGLTREQLADLPVEAILKVAERKPLAADVEILLELAKRHRQTQRIASACPMPALITSEDDFVGFWLMDAQPNFIGTSRVRGEVVCVNNGGVASGDLRGKVVLIPQADPGYDWLFGQGIAALITMYGGSNSHMAIRSAEFRLPAAIGVGERLYQALSEARVIDLDPANQRVEKIA